MPPNPLDKTSLHEDIQAIVAALNTMIATQNIHGEMLKALIVAARAPTPADPAIALLNAIRLELVENKKALAKLDTALTILPAALGEELDAVLKKVM
jgi:hypothetical protein